MKNHKTQGGTELLLEGLSKYVDLSGVNMILSNCFDGNIKEGKPNILWEHMDVDQDFVQNIKNQQFTSRLDALVFVSGWQYGQYLGMNIPMDKSHMIRNAIEPLEYKPKGDKIKLIYASTPFRGLNLLLDVFEEMDRDDIELDVYSSTIIYGDGFAREVGDQFEPLFQRARDMKNVNYMGYAPNSEVRKAMQDSHILAYPSTFRETSCLVAMEAGAAGCQIVTTNYGALPETTAGFGTLVPLSTDARKFKNDYREALEYAIDNRNEDDLKFQSEYFNKMYTWERRAPEWERLLDKLSR